MALRDLILSTRPTGPLFSIKGRRFGFLVDGPTDLDGVEGLLRDMEARGASAQNLSEALVDAYHDQFPVFLGLSRGFRRREEISRMDPRMALWALAVFRDPWRVLDDLGTVPWVLVRYLIACWRPEVWLKDADLVRVPEELRRHLEPSELVYGSQDQPVDLRWLGSRLSCGLSVMGPVPGLLLPDALKCMGDVQIAGVHGLQDLTSLVAPGRRLVVSTCPQLEKLQVPEGTILDVRDCPKLTWVWGEVTADLQVANCPALGHLDVLLPREAVRPPSLTIQRCNALTSIGRYSGVPRLCRDLVIEDCPKLEKVESHIQVRWERRITNCPGLERDQR